MSDLSDYGIWHKQVFTVQVISVLLKSGKPQSSICRAQTAELKLESFEFTKYGVIDGIISDISTDAVEMENVGLVFPLKVTLKQHSIKAGNKTVPLGSGMAVTVEVKTGQ